MEQPAIARTYGTCELAHGGRWKIEAEPQAMMQLRRMFANAKRQAFPVFLPATLDAAEDLSWFMSRYPLEMSEADRRKLTSDSKACADRRNRAHAILAGGSNGFKVDTAIPLRDYQKQFVEFARHTKRIVLGDDVGLGKSASAIGVLCDPSARPALVVVQAHLQRQWREQLGIFSPMLNTHIIKKTKEYDLPQQTDVYIISYAKLASWAERLGPSLRTVIYDECQELRRPGTLKYEWAKHLSEKETVKYVLGLSATPIFNYGDETHTVFSAINPGVLGTRDEFIREWCSPIGMNYSVDNPEALGSYLREQGFFLRRKRSDVSRELPAVSRIIHEVPYDKRVMDDLRHDALALAKQMLEGTFNERGQAARELDSRLRQATGIAKAPFVADFVGELAKQGQKIVLTGWHREVYSVWRHRLNCMGVKSVLYTGSESPAAKDKSVQAFLDDGDDAAMVFIMSLRSGAGLDGLQKASSIIVHGELDWSPKVHEQNEGRLNRDGQPDPVTAFYIVTSCGSDPTICALLGIKAAQSDGIVNLGERAKPAENLFGNNEEAMTEDSRIKQLAKDFIAQRSI